MRILVLGGSYFAGRVYVRVASDLGHNISVVNRGNYPLNIPGVKEYQCDRHNPEKLRELLAGESFDVLVDFCAYEPGDVSSILNVLGHQVSHYILLSTTSLYSAEAVNADENSPLQASFPQGPVGDYLRGKAAVEKELISQSMVPWTSLRPAFIYGPYNYAPREPWMIKLLCQNESLPYPTDAQGRWTFVYVKDVAEAIEKVASNPRTIGQIYNLSAPEAVDYASFYAELERCWGAPIPRRPMSCHEVERDGVPLPFPLMEDLRYRGDKISRELGLKYTPLSEGLDRTVRAFRSIYGG